MQTNSFIALILISSLGVALAEENSMMSLEEVRKLGRERSIYLSEKANSETPAILNSEPDIDGFNKIILPIFKKSCINCHGPKKSKGDFRVDELSGDLLHGPNINEWLEIYEVVSNDEMPPEEKPKYALEDSVRAEMIDWIGLELKKANSARKNEAGHSSFRRMTKYEYNYALQDLLDLPYNFAEDLPPENISEDGFKNSSHLLQMSAMQFETYREIGLRALTKATVKGKQPKPINFMLSLEALADQALERERKKLAAQKEAEAKAKLDKEQKQEGDKKEDVKKKKKKKRKGVSGLNIYNHLTKKSVKSGDWSLTRDLPLLEIPSVSSNVYVLNGNSALKMNMFNHLPDEGVMRIRIRVGRTTNEPNHYSSLRIGISAQTSNNANFAATISDRDLPVTASHDNPEIIEFMIPLAEIPRNPLKNEKGKGRMVNEFINIRHVSNPPKGGKAPQLYIDYLDISAPHYEVWPPASHQRIFVVESGQKDETSQAREVLTRFMVKAWRRPIEKTEVDRFMKLFELYLPNFQEMEGAMLEVLAAVIASPEFLYINRSGANLKGREKVTDLELASRLSFFLWSSLPDEELISLAQKNQLSRPEVLTGQIERMLQNNRARRFSENFVSQWLGLEGIDNISVDKKVHKGYDESLKVASNLEPIKHFDEVLSNNLSLLDFIHSDYILVNETLAKHYNIPEVYGPHFRKVPLGKENLRGGVMTTAGVMTANSDGKDSHPLKRGVWLLERILNDPPPPPPPNVPEVDLTDPDILKMTLKERMADHRNHPACMSCHAKIDPWGIAFENLNAIGGFRTKIGEKDVDATSELYNKQKLNGIVGLKHYLLLDRQDQFVRAVVHKMVSYALGRHLSFQDREAIDKLSIQLRKKGDRLKDLVGLIINSDLFMMN